MCITCLIAIIVIATGAAISGRPVAVSRFPVVPSRSHRAESPPPISN
jgi:hypothetical protein